MITETTGYYEQRFPDPAVTANQLAWGALLVYLVTNVISYSFRNNLIYPRQWICYPLIFVLNLFFLWTLIRYYFIVINTKQIENVPFFFFSILCVLYSVVAMQPDSIILRNILFSGWGAVCLLCCALFLLAPDLDNLIRFTKIYCRFLLLPMCHRN